MPRKKIVPGLGDPDKIVSSYESDAASSINEAVLQQRSSRKIDLGEEDAEITLPNGQTSRLSEVLSLIDHDYIHEDIKSIYADPTNYLKHVKPGHMYAWPSLKDPSTLAKIRSQLYRPVERDEVLDDTASPIEFKAKAGIEFACIGDVALVEISPRGVARLYGNPAAQAVMRTARNQSYMALKNKIERESNGLVTVEMEQSGE